MRKKKEWKRVIGIAAALLVLPALSGCSQESTDAVQDAVDQVQSVITGDQPLEVESVSEDKYAYSTLDDETRKVYDEIVYTFQNREEEVQIATTDPDKMELAYLAVRYDYCEFFWVNQFSYVTYTRDDEITSISITPDYSMTEEEQAAYQSQIDAEAERLLADAPTDGSDFDKALYVYETLIHNVDYVVNADNSQNLISAFVNHQTVCQGYAYATQYLLNRLGIPCSTVVGVANNENHAWNLVILDGDYYYLDTTWGNPQFINGDSGEGSEFQYIDYDYFGATTEMISDTHQADERIALPECTATSDNYFIHEGKYVEDWDPDQVGGIIAQAYQDGNSQVQIKFANADLYEQALQYFLEDYHLSDYCEGLNSVQYMENPDNNVLCLIYP